MTLGRLRHPFSCLILFLTFIVISPATFGQASTDAGIGDPTRAATPANKSDAIDTVNGRIRSDPQERVWQMTGPFGGDVTALAIDSRYADRILLGTSDGQIFRSTDGGSIWKRIRPGIKATGFTVTLILFDHEKPGMIYVCVKAVTALGEETKGGSIYVSADSGENWREFEGMHGKAVRGMVQSTKDANVLAAAALDGIYLSKDRGQSWQRVTPPNDPELRGFHSVAIDPRDTDIIYVGTNHLPWKTLDGGQTWKRAGSKETGMIDDSDIFAIHIDEANPDVVLMSACSGIYRSLDASSKWTKIQGIPYTSRRTHVIYQHPARPEVVFAGTTEGLWLSTNFGKPDSWRRVTSLRLVINAIAIHPDRPDRVLLGTEDNGVLISNDGGETYDLSNAGFTNRQVRTVMPDQKERGRVYAGVIFDGVNSGLFVSEDSGLSWQQSMNGMGVRDVYSLYQSTLNLETIYAGTNHGLFRSDDNGRNWFQVKKEEPEPEGETKIDGPGNQTQPAQPDSQITPKKTRPRRVNPSLSPSPSNDTGMVELIVYTRTKSSKAKPQAKKSSGSRKGKQAKAKTRKPAQTAQKPKPQPGDLIDLQSHVFAIAPLMMRREAVEAGGAGDIAAQQPPPNVLLASTWDGLFRSEDEKKGWKLLKLRPSIEGEPAPPKQPRIIAIATSPHAPGVIHAGAEEGLFISTDNGDTFNLMPLDNEVKRIRSIVFDPRTAETIYVGTTTGFFRSTDGGRTWENRGGGMPLLSDISVIAVNGLNPDELYVSDEMRSCFYFSKDSGKSWEKLDINQLPSTKIGSLVSDPFDRNKLYAGSFSGGVYVMSRR